MVLRNHGILTCGGSVPEAFFHMYMVIKASRIQAHALSCVGSLDLRLPSEESVGFTAVAARSFNVESIGKLEFDALMRDLDRSDPSFRL